MCLRLHMLMSLLLHNRTYIHPRAAILNRMAVFIYRYLKAKIMGKQRQGIFGPISGKVDGLVGRVIRHKGIIQSKGNMGKYPRSAAQIVIQNRYRKMMATIEQLPDAYYTYAWSYYYEHAMQRPQFMHYNWQYCDQNQGVTPADGYFVRGLYSNVRDMYVSIDGENGIVEAAWELPNDGTVYGDQVFLCMLFKNLTTNQWIEIQADAPASSLGFYITYINFDRDTLYQCVYFVSDQQDRWRPSHVDGLNTLSS